VTERLSELIFKKRRKPFDGKDPTIHVRKKVKKPFKGKASGIHFIQTLFTFFHRSYALEMKNQAHESLP